MFASFTLTLLLAASTAFASPFNVTRKVCATVPSDADVARMEKDYQDKKVPASGRVAVHTTLNIYWHVISENSTPAGGNIPDSQIAAQLKVVNTTYASMGISWVLAGTDRTENADWFNNVAAGNAQQRAMKRALRKGTVKDLNVYSVGFKSRAAAGSFGYATLPADYTRNPIDDGAVILFSTLPGGASAPINLGQTLTHEAGHWSGLYHTFQGGCGTIGDQVDDTPPERIAASGCPIGRDTCTGGGVDPIHNYMDYADDSCMSEFTPGQIVRARAQLATYRGVPA